MSADISTPLARADLAVRLLRDEVAALTERLWTAEAERDALALDGAS